MPEPVRDSLQCKNKAASKALKWRTDSEERAIRGSKEVKIEFLQPRSVNLTENDTLPQNHNQNQKPDQNGRLNPSMYNGDQGIDDCETKAVNQEDVHMLADAENAIADEVENLLVEEHQDL